MSFRRDRPDYEKPMHFFDYVCTQKMQFASFPSTYGLIQEHQAGPSDLSFITQEFDSRIDSLQAQFESTTVMN